MSYSVSVRAVDKDHALMEVRAKLNDVVVSQPVHENDVNQAHDAVASLLNLIGDAPDRDLSVSLAGSVSVGERINGLELHIRVGRVDREKAE